MKTKQYGVWEDGDEAGGGYWFLFDSIEDAVSEQGDGCEVYLLEAKLLGRYKRKVSIVSIVKTKQEKKKGNHG